MGGWQAASGVHGTGASLDTHSWLYVEEDLFGRPGSSGVSGFWLAFLPRCFEDFRKFCVNRAESIFPVGERSTQARWASGTGRGRRGGATLPTDHALVRERPLPGSQSQFIPPEITRKPPQCGPAPTGRQRAACSSGPPAGRPVWGSAVRTRRNAHSPPPPGDTSGPLPGDKPSVQKSHV